MILGRLSISRRILLVLLIGIMTPAFLTVQSLISFRQSLLKARSTEVQHLDEAAWTIVATYQKQAVAGLMTEQNAKEAAKAAIRAMRYDGTNYFFIWDLNGVGIAHGGNVALEGKTFLTGPDAIAKPGVADMVTKLVAVARDKGEGFARYEVPKAGQTEPLDKIGYSKLFKPWGWAIGTGAYVVDIDAAFWARARSDMLTAFYLTAIAGLLSFVLARDLTQALTALASAMKKLARGELSTPIPSLDRQDEVGAMAATVQVFKENANRTRALETEKADARRAAAEASTLVVSSIGEGLERLASGDLTYRLETKLPRDYERLGANFNSASSQLKTLVQGIIDNTSAICSGTSGVALAAADLSERSEQRAVTLGKTAAALSNVTSTMNKNAQISLEARKLVSAARDDAEQTAGVMREAVGAMSAIETSSHQINRIVGVIDTIAAQSGLLALNAGLEAARAGEAGRGFMVVATEVRALAKRSAEAAMEIKGLIGASTRQVEKGVALVGETGRALDRIFERVYEISARIADSAEHQAAGLLQLDTAMGQMDLVAQQNAAIVEKNVSASVAVVREAEKLALLTGRFQVATGGKPILKPLDTAA